MGVIEAKDIGREPRWVATLGDDTTVVGRPSWLGSSCPVPDDGAHPMSDWRRLQQRCVGEGIRLKKLALWISPWGFFRAPEGKDAYGYFETMVASQGVMGCEALSVCWSEGDVIRIMSVLAQGTMEMRKLAKRSLPCMIGCGV